MCKDGVGSFAARVAVFREGSVLRLIPCKRIESCVSSHSCEYHIYNYCVVNQLSNYHTA